MLRDPGGTHARTDLLIRRSEEYDVALERDVRALQDQHRHELRDRLALHVERAPAPHVAVFDQAAERIHGPVLGRRDHDVHVIEENQGPGAAIAAQPGVEVRLPRCWLEDLRLDAVAPQYDS